MPVVALALDRAVLSRRRRSRAVQFDLGGDLRPVRDLPPGRVGRSQRPERGVLAQRPLGLRGSHVPLDGLLGSPPGRGGLVVSRDSVRAWSRARGDTCESSGRVAAGCLNVEDPLTSQPLDEFGKSTGWGAGKVVSAIVNGCANEIGIVSEFGAEPSNHVREPLVVAYGRAI